MKPEVFSGETTALLRNGVPVTLAWIDEFWQNAGKYIFSREDDGILILPPNRVYKINTTGAALIALLKSGKKAAEIPVADEERLRSIDSFFRIIAGLYSYNEGAENALARIPFDFEYTRLPILAEIALTYRCNNRCRFCYAGCNNETDSCADSGPAIEGIAFADKTDAQKETAANRKKHERTSNPAGTANRSDMEDRSTAEIKRIIDIFKHDAKIPFFSFTGGEPLLRGDLEELIAYAVSLSFEVNLISNGTLASDTRAASLYKAGLQTAQISIEGPDEELHDFLAGRRGSFAQTLEGIAALQKAGISVQTNTTISRANIEKAVAMPAFLKTLGIGRFAMNMFIPSGTGLSAKELFVGYDEIGAIVDAVRKEAFAQDMTFYWYSPTPFCYYNPIARGLGNKSCAAVDGLLSVAPNGDVLPCSSWDEPIGNLLKMPFGKLWFSERAQFFKHKQFAPQKCKDCSSFTACQGACPLYWASCGESLLEADL